MFRAPHSYAVYVPPGAWGGDYSAAIFVKEGFSFPAFVFKFLWAAYHKLWWPAAALFAISLGLGALEASGFLSTGGTAALQLGYGLIVGYSAGDWLGAGLKRKGYALAEIVYAESETAAQLRFFDRHLAA